ncbi:hypothetical protein CEXT_387441 [Caerostris extrusa]|uniref:Uncharacterized protein n=1 Tax=Caerostris extrusa TaxID=172846 RepID=A0AAV4P2V1_CAEEX|nr:hypothetical protein CEXT_387441 [Caerostris extrusa]
MTLKFPCRNECSAPVPLNRGKRERNRSLLIHSILPLAWRTSRLRNIGKSLYALPLPRHKLRAPGSPEFFSAFCVKSTFRSHLFCCRPHVVIGLDPSEKESSLVISIDRKVTSARTMLLFHNLLLFF